MKETEFFKLNKPEPTDYVNIEDLNENFDLIDEGLKENQNHVEDKSNPHNTTKEQVGLKNVDNVQQASKEEFDDLSEEVTTHSADKASLTNTGHVKLNSSTDSADETSAATPKAVKAAMDQANNAMTAAESTGLVIEKFDIPGSYSWTVPEGVTEVYVTGCGGGGGGGSTSNITAQHGGSGAAGGITSFGSYATVSGGGGGSGVNSNGQPSDPSLNGMAGGDFADSAELLNGVGYRAGRNLFVSYGKGGGGTTAWSSGYSRAGGAGGVVLDKLVQVSPGKTIPITVGAGGKGGTFTALNGRNGGAGTDGILVIKHVK